MSIRLGIGDTVRFKGGKDEWTVDSVAPHPDDGFTANNGTMMMPLQYGDVELVRKAKKMVKKSGFVNLYKSDTYAARTLDAYHTKQDADIYAGTSRIACVEIHWEEEEND